MRRGSRYHAVLDLPPTADGRRRQKWLSGFATRRDAEAALAAATAEVHTGRYVEPARLTLNGYLTGEWLPASAAETVRFPV